jgi:hypothetical protein
VVTGNVCDLFLRTNGGTATTLYVKETGTGNTGWAAVGAGGGGAPTGATYITQTADATLSAEQALGALATGLMNSTTTTGVVSTIAPTDDNVVVGSGTAWQLKTVPDCIDVTGNHLNYTQSTNTISCGTSGGGGSTHVILDSTVHTDTLTGTVVRGDIIVGNATPKWSRFAKCANGSLIQYNATDPACVNIYNTANTWGADQTISSGSGSLNFILKSRFNNSPSNSIKWTDSGDETGIELTSGTTHAGDFEVNLNNQNDGSGNVTFMAWRWLGQEKGGNVEHTPRGTAVITANANQYGYWLKPKWTEGTSGTHALIAGIRIDKPVLTNGTATTTEESTLYIEGADAGALATNTYALHVAADTSKFDGHVVNGVDARTIADNGGGTNATLTLTPTTGYVEITCNDAQGCDITMGETGMLQGARVTIVNVSTGTVNFADTASVSEIAGAFAAGQYDAITLRYTGSTWFEESRSNN